MLFTGMLFRVTATAGTAIPFLLLLPFTATKAQAHDTDKNFLEALEIVVSFAII